MTTPTPTAREVRDGLAYLLNEVRRAHAPDGLLVEARTMYHAGDMVTGDERVRRVRDLLRVLEEMLLVVRWPEDGR